MADSSATLWTRGKQRMRKRIGAVLLTVCLLLGLLPTTALAGGFEVTNYSELVAKLEELRGNEYGGYAYLSPAAEFGWPENAVLTIPANVGIEVTSGYTWEIPNGITVNFEANCYGIQCEELTINGTMHMAYSTQDTVLRQCDRVIIGPTGTFTCADDHPDYTTVYGIYIPAESIWEVQAGGTLNPRVSLYGTLTGSGTVSGAVQVQGGFSGTASNATLSGNLALTGGLSVGNSNEAMAYDDTLTVPSGSHITATGQCWMNINNATLHLNGELEFRQGNTESSANPSIGPGGKMIMGDGKLILNPPYRFMQNAADWADGEPVTFEKIQNAVPEPLIDGAGIICFNDNVNAPGEESGWIFSCHADLVAQAEEQVKNNAYDPDEADPMTWAPVCMIDLENIAIERSWDSSCVHNWEKTGETPATCTEQGYSTYTCSKCQATKQDDFVSALGHDLTYTASGSTITEDCQREDCDHTATATLSAADGVYTGQAVENGKVVYSEGWLGGDLTITYSDNINAGTAAASITVDEISANVTFQIARAEHTMSLANLSQTSGNVSAVTCTVSPSDSTAKITVEYQVGGQWTDQLPTAVGSYPVRARVAESDNLVLADVGTYTTGTLTISQRSSGGSSSGSSSNSGNKTEVEKNPDGSTTTTVTKPSGTVTETTKYPDGAQEVVETKKDGTVTTTTTDKTGNETEVVENTDGTTRTTITNEDGSSSVTKTDKDGNVEAQVKLPTDVVEDAVQKGWAVALPMPSISASSDRDEAPAVTVDLPRNIAAKVEIPVEDVTSGTVAVLVKADGTGEIIKTSLTTGDGVTVTLSDGDTVKIVDNSRDFADVPDAHWASEAVDFAASRELFAGTSDTTFAPEVAMNRAMIVTVLARFEGVDTSGGDSWYEAGQQWAVENGISDGTSLDQNLTREQLITMLWRYAGSPVIEMGLGDYPDCDSISSWAVKAMAWAVNAGIITGADGGTLAPQGVASRAQVAAILMRFVENTV